ncbi:hypothetical protein EXO80_25475 [Salmonella enterica]|nr:hypothetical protein [Salmonella enterica]ECH1725879.1 hypothetical protein [Salmonella enterica]
MKLNRITASLLTVIGSHLLAQPAFADRIIQRPSGAFYIVSDLEASQAFDRNNFGFFALPPSVNPPLYKSAGKGVAKKRIAKRKPVKAPVQCPPVNCPVVPEKSVKPVTTIEPTESIFLRLEQKK